MQLKKEISTKTIGSLGNVWEKIQPQKFALSITNFHMFVKNDVLLHSFSRQHFIQPLQ